MKRLNEKERKVVVELAEILYEYAVEASREELKQLFNDKEKIYATLNLLTNELKFWLLRKFKMDRLLK